MKLERTILDDTDEIQTVVEVYNFTLKLTQGDDLIILTKKETAALKAALNEIEE